MAVCVKEYTLFRENEIRPLYAENGWESYLRKADLLENAYAHSLKTLAAYDGDKLVGIIRAVGDGVSILYIQDLLVLPVRQHQGIGRQLLKAMLDCYPDVNQTVLLTDDAENTVSFYRDSGFQKVEKAGCVSFIRLHSCYQSLNPERADFPE